MEGERSEGPSSVEVEGGGQDDLEGHWHEPHAKGGGAAVLKAFETIPRQALGKYRRPTLYQAHLSGLSSVCRLPRIEKVEEGGLSVIRV